MGARKTKSNDKEVHRLSKSGRALRKPGKYTDYACFFTKNLETHLENKQKKINDPRDKYCEHKRTIRTNMNANKGELLIGKVNVKRVKYRGDTIKTDPTTNENKNSRLKLWKEIRINRFINLEPKHIHIKPVMRSVFDFITPFRLIEGLDLETLPEIKEENGVCCLSDYDDLFDCELDQNSTESLTVAAGLNLLGEAFTNIGTNLSKNEETGVVVVDSESVLLDALLCALSTLPRLLNCVPGFENCVQTNVQLEDIQCMFPGF